MKFLIDTNVISDFVKGHPQVSKNLLARPPEEIAVSAISQMEVEYGLLGLTGRYEKELRSSLAAFFKTVYVLPFDEHDALCAAKVRSFLKKKGRPIGPYDILLAGMAQNRDLIFVTSNTSEFQRVPQLQIVDWRITA